MTSPIATRHAETLRRIARAEEPFDPAELLDAADYIDELFSVVIDVDLSRDGAALPSAKGKTP